MFNDAMWSGQFNNMNINDISCFITNNATRFEKESVKREQDFLIACIEQ